MDDVQKTIDKTALAISTAELRTAALLAGPIGRLHGAVEDFRKGCGLHATTLAAAHGHVGDAAQLISAGLVALAAAHAALEEVRCRHDPPLPVPTGGGGGGK